MNFKEVNASVNFSQLEDGVKQFWKENNIKKKCLQANEGKEFFNFYEGPPTANGKPHLGHVFTRALKDLYCRYKNMQGYHVTRKGGWDTHGLPVEIEVEKLLGLDGKKDIEKYGIEGFVKECKNNIFKYIDLWDRFSANVAYSINTEDDFYATYTDNYIESCWWALKELYNKNLLYKGHKILPSCPKCGTALSSHELAQGYAERTDLTMVAKFYSETVGANFLAWTTTPWTLFSNVALCVNSKIEYSLVSCKDGKYILASSLIEKWFEDKEHTVEKTYLGSELEGLKYQPLFDVATPEQLKTGYRIVSADFVTVTDGTGIVHIAPAFGEDDSQVGKKFDLPFIQNVDIYGRFDQTAGKFAGAFVFDSNEEIIRELSKEDKVFKVQKFKHEYPHCWRCKTPMMYYARPNWFIKTSSYKNEMIKNNKTVNWIPENIKDGRMGKFYENNIDWCLGRNRYWGTPLPIWVCDDCGKIEVMGSKQELLDRAGATSIEELHKPYVDNLKVKCSCGGKMIREEDVCDCWFDSGAMPFAQHHYPFENKELFEKNFPADFISEGKDQTRGWFYTMQALATPLFGKSPYKTVIANGMVVDEKGKKLSKSLGNYVDPMVLINNFGGDTVRWNLYTFCQPHGDPMASDKYFAQAQGRFISTLWNTYSFFVLYANIDSFDPSKVQLDKCHLTIMDKWILSKLNTLIGNMNENLNHFKGTEAAKLLEQFIDDLSNWYIRRCRKRYWGEGMTEDKKAAYATLYTTLVNVVKLAAPFVPFVTENIYQNLVVSVNKNAEQSVHLCSYPKADKAYVNTKLEKEMQSVYKICELGRSARSGVNIKIRQPLESSYVTFSSKGVDISDYANIIKEELNVKNVIVSKDLNQFASFVLKPQLKTLGPKYGKLISGIYKMLAESDGNAIVSHVNSGKTYTADVDGVQVELTKNDLIVSIVNKEGYAMASEGEVGVALDTNITEELFELGLVREFVSRVQAKRKGDGFAVTDRIAIVISSEQKVHNIIEKHIDSIKKDVLATSIAFSPNKVGEHFELNGEFAYVTITKH